MQWWITPSPRLRCTYPVICNTFPSLATPTGTPYRPPVTTISASQIQEDQTRSIIREFGSSKPRPRNRAMGFKEEDKPHKKERKRPSVIRLIGW